MDPFELLKAGDLAGLKSALDADPALAAMKGADGASLFSFAYYAGSREAAEIIRAALPGLTPHEAIIAGDEAELHAAIEHGWDANELAPDGFTPLSLAAFFGHTALIELLLPLTADVNARARNGQQVAALHAAAARRANDIVTLLLRAGADPDLPQQQGFRAIHTAAMHGDAATCGQLILFGADPHLANDEGKSAVDFAREGGHDWLAQQFTAHRH